MAYTLTWFFSRLIILDNTPIYGGIQILRLATYNYVYALSTMEVVRYPYSDID